VSSRGYLIAQAYEGSDSIQRRCGHPSYSKAGALHPARSACLGERAKHVDRACVRRRLRVVVQLGLSC